MLSKVEMARGRRPGRLVGGLGRLTMQLQQGFTIGGMGLRDHAAQHQF